MNRRTIALLSGLLALAGSMPATAQVAYIPPGPQPRFGGQIPLTEPGSVVGYWNTRCTLIRKRFERKRDGAAAPPELEATLKRFINGIMAEQPSYADMSPAMAAAVRKNISTYWPALNNMGLPTVNKKVDKDKAGNDVYVVNVKGGRTHWAITVDGQGKIDGATVCLGNGV